MRTLRKVNSYLLAFGLLVLSLSLHAQNNFRFRNYTINDGLSQSTVLCVLQDDDHAIWVGTQDGINRFDGHHFEVFNADEIEGLSSSYAKVALKGPKGNLWFGTVNGLVKYNTFTELFESYKSDPNDVLNIESMTFGPQGKLWIATATKGVLIFNPSTNTFEKQSVIKARKPKQVFFTSEKMLVHYSEDFGLQLSDIKGENIDQIVFPNKGTKTIVWHISQFETNSILIGTNYGVYQYDIVNKELTKFFSQLDKEFGYLNVVSILQNADKEWFIGTKKKGLFVIDREGIISNNTQDIFQKNALLYNEINYLFEDLEGTFWIASGRGLSSFDPNNQGILGVGPSGNLQHGIPTPSVWSFAEDKDSRYIYIGTDAGVSRMDRRTGKFRQFYRQSTDIASLGDGRETAVLGLYLINPNHLLVGCIDGLYELKIKEESYSFDPIVKNQKNDIFNRSYRIQYYEGNDYFIATKSGVVQLNLKTRAYKVFKHDPKHPESTIRPGICRMIFEDKKGGFWFSTNSGGLNKLTRRNDSLLIIPFAQNKLILDSIPEYITTMYEDRSGTFWLGTLGGGIAKYDREKNSIELITKEDGLPNNVIYSILEDGRHNLWCSTNKGLVRINTEKKTFTDFTEVHGLMSNEFNSGAFLHSKSGIFYFGGIYGFNYFDPLTLNDQRNNVSVVFSRLKLDDNWLHPKKTGSPLNKPLSEMKELNLPYTQRNFTISFIPSKLSNPELVNYKYVLKGSSDDEVFIGNANELRFNALSSGTYELMVYARLGEESWSDQPTTLIINIAAPFWNKWWFWTLMILLLGIIVYVFIRRRIEHERREQVRLEIKIAERTREIRAQNVQIERQKKALEKEKEKVEKQSKLLEIERDKSQKLLKNVIPASMAEELLEKGKSSARSFKTVSVLFTDFVGFTKIADKIKPNELVTKLDTFFKKFDEIIINNNLEKIKTIGDAYMCAGGVPVRNNTNPIDTVLAGIQIQHYMNTLDQTDLPETLRWKLRLGINTGEVTAGAIGRERLAYDVWGATVNQAQRMEMMGEPGVVTVTGNTFYHIEPYFECKYKGEVESKSKGIIEMYQVIRIKPELSVDGEGIYPNERFHQIVNLHHYSSINYYRAERHIMQVLMEGLSEKLHYHSIRHMKDVVEAVERLALSEDVTDEGLFLLKTAATYHDAGFVEQYDKNEPIGARMAEEILPNYGYSKDHIEKIKELIFVTEIPHKPKNKLEEIICDADLDYLGRDDFHEIADRLRRELKEHGKIDSDRKWDEIQVSFLTAHKYFTKTAIDTRQAKKMQHIEEIKQRLEKDEYED